MNYYVFSLTGLFLVKRDKLSTGYSCLNQVLKKIFFQAILYMPKVYGKMFIKNIYIYNIILNFNYYKTDVVVL